MAILTKEVKVIPVGKLIKYYRCLGYDVKYREPLVVKVSDLPICSTAVIEIECDYCQKEKRMVRYVDYNAQTKNGTRKCCCSNCVPLKREEAMLKEYGYKNALQVPEIKDRVQKTNQERYGSNSPSGNAEVREKQKHTLMENYGVENPSQSKEIQDRRKQTFIERFGVENPLLNPEIKEKAQKTIFELYGVENVFFNDKIKAKRDKTLMERYGTLYPLQNEECFEKLKQTNMRKYGKEFVSQLEETKQKVKQTNLDRCGHESYMQSPKFLKKWFAKNGSDFVRSSKQQCYLCNLYNGVLNHPFKCFALDVYLPDNKLDVEFDGSGHRMSISLGSITEEEFEKKELYRNVALKKEGYKQMRIISIKDLLPSDQVLLQMLEKAKQYFSNYPNHSWIEFNIDASIVRNAEHKDGVFFDFGELRKISKADVSNIDNNQNDNQVA